MPKLRKRSEEELRPCRYELDARAAFGDLRFPEDFKTIRKTIGLTQAEFAKYFHLTRQQVIDIEAGRANPNLETLKKIAKPFGFHVGFVKGRDINRNHPGVRERWRDYCAKNGLHDGLSDDLDKKD